MLLFDPRVTDLTRITARKLEWDGVPQGQLLASFERTLMDAEAAVMQHCAASGINVRGFGGNILLGHNINAFDLLVKITQCEALQVDVYSVFKRCSIIATMDTATMSRDTVVWPGHAADERPRYVRLVRCRAGLLARLLHAR